MKDRLQLPDGRWCLIPGGRLFVSDALQPRAGVRITFTRKSGGQPPHGRDRRGQDADTSRPHLTGGSRRALFMVAGSSLGVVDSVSSRILIFEPLDQWPGEDIMLSPQARYVVGQGPSTYNEFNSRKPNNGLPEATENTLYLPGRGGGCRRGIIRCRRREPSRDRNAAAGQLLCGCHARARADCNST